MESKHIVNVKIYGAYHIGHQQLTRIKVNVTVSHGLETIEIDLILTNWVPALSSHALAFSLSLLS